MIKENKFLVLIIVAVVVSFVSIFIISVYIQFEYAFGYPTSREHFEISCVADEDCELTRTGPCSYAFCTNGEVIPLWGIFSNIPPSEYSKSFLVSCSPSGVIACECRNNVCTGIHTYEISSSEYCLTINTERERDDCFYYYAFIHNDTEACLGINNTYTKEVCLQRAERGL